MSLLIVKVIAYFFKSYLWKRTHVIDTSNDKIFLGRGTQFGVQYPELEIVRDICP